MVTKLEYAEPVYYCRVKKELEFEGFDWVALGDGKTKPLENTKCELTKHEGSTPDCRGCDVRKKNEWIFDKSKR